MNNLAKTSIWIMICMFLLNVCNNNEQASTSNEEEMETKTDKPENDTESFQAEDILYAWVKSISSLLDLG